MFNDCWVEVYRAENGRILRVMVCDHAGQRVNLPITSFEVQQAATDLGRAKFEVVHGRVEYKDA